MTHSPLLCRLPPKKSRYVRSLPKLSFRSGLCFPTQSREVLLRKAQEAAVWVHIGISDHHEDISKKPQIPTSLLYVVGHKKQLAFTGRCHYRICDTNRTKLTVSRIAGVWVDKRDVPLGTARWNVFIMSFALAHGEMTFLAKWSGDNSCCRCGSVGSGERSFSRRKEELFKHNTTTLH